MFDQFLNSGIAIAGVDVGESYGSPKGRTVYSALYKGFVEKGGLVGDLKRKSIEPIALASGVAVRTLQEFLAFFKWDHQLVEKTLVREVIDRQHGKPSIGVLDVSAGQIHTRCSTSMVR